MAKRYQYQNTRIWTRLPVDWYVKYALADSPGPEALVTAADISAGGLRLMTRERVPVGTRLQLKINVPPLRRGIAAEGRVVRVIPRTPGTIEWGVEFEQMAETDRAELNQQIEAMVGPGRLTRQRGAWWRRV